MRWQAHEIGDVAQINPRLAAAERPDLNDKVSFVPMASVSEETMSIAVHEERPFSEVSKGYTPFMRGDVLVAKITPCFENGKMALADNLSHELGFGTTEFHVLRPSERVTGPYLFNILRVPWLRAAGAMKMRGAAGQRRVPADFIASVEIPVPPIAEQKRITRILDGVDALRAKRREALAQLDSLIQSTFLTMFGDPVTNPNEWEVKPLKKLLGEKSINGAYYPKDAYSSVGTRMVHMANAFYGEVNPDEVKRVDAPLADVEKYSLLPTDILVSRRSLNYEGSAKPCLIPEAAEPLIFESSLIRVRPNRKRVLTIYLFHYLSNDRARAKYVFPLVTRSTISGINQSNLMKVKVVLPPLDLQHRFAAIVHAVEQQRARQRSHLAELDTLFASLQSQAFRGEL